MGELGATGRDAGIAMMQEGGAPTGSGERAGQRAGDLAPGDSQSTEEQEPEGAGRQSGRQELSVGPAAS